MAKKTGLVYTTLISVRDKACSVISARANDDLDFVLRYWNRVIVEARAARPVGRPKKAADQEGRPELIGRYAHEHSPEEAAATFNCTVNTAKQHRSRYRRRYKKYP
jgi:hypothetical protein